MSQPYVGEIRMFGGNFAPAGWAFCDGQLVSISDNETLFQLIGTTYGGDGQVSFGLPDLRGRLPVHMGSGPGLTPRTIGEMGGQESVTVTTSQILAHSHALLASSATANAGSPSGNVPAASTSIDLYTTADPTDAMAATALAGTGGSQPHDNMMPYLCISFIISFFGIFPSPS